MRVDPEWPQSVVQIKSNQLWEWETICEGVWGHGGILEGLSVLALCSHDRSSRTDGREIEEAKKKRRG